MPDSRIAIRLGALSAAAAAILCVAPALASANVYCVHDPACPVGGAAKDTLFAAVSAADADATPDTVRVGPGVYSSQNVSPANPVEIAGAGIGATEIEATQANAGLIYFLNGQSKVHDLTVGLTQDNQRGVTLGGGADAERVKVKGPHSLKAVSGFVAEDPGTELRSVVVDLGPDMLGAGIRDMGETTITDSTVTAGVGISPSQTYWTHARRITVHSFVPLSVVGGGLTITNALLTSYPEPGLETFAGADVINDNAGGTSVLSAYNLTIVGPGSGYGILARNSSASTGWSKAIVHGTVIRGVTHDLSRDGDSATETANIDISWSAYDAAKVENPVGNGVLTVGPGNLTGGQDPRFVDAPAGDYRLRFDSPLLDRVPVAGSLLDDDPDLAHKSRVRDSDGNGTAVRDIGAYEYQRLAPVVHVMATPLTAPIGAPIAFASKATDPDGDPIVARGWSFGDGGTAAGASASHAYSTPGTPTVAFSAKDATGLTGSATHSVTISAPPGAALLPGACANRRSGGAGADLLTGSAAGDLLVGGAGADRLLGAGGADCLRGGSGKDRLNGGRGDDSLNGGRGRDVLVGGAGNDRIKAGARDAVKAGPGSDRVAAANGQPNTVACGKGRDRVTADRADRLTGCERVRFPRP